MRLAMEAAQFTPDEADALRRAMATFRRRGTLSLLKEKMVGRMVARGYEPALAERCFRQIEGFGDYGFPESHAASFALLAYVLLVAQVPPPGRVCVRAAERPAHGLLRPGPDRPRRARARRRGAPGGCQRERMGQQPGGCGGGSPARSTARSVSACARWAACARRTRHASWTRAQRARGHAPYPDVATLHRRAGIPVSAIETLAAADAFRSAGLDRRQALWQARALAKAPPLPLFEAAGPARRGAGASGDAPGHGRRRAGG